MPALVSLGHVVWILADLIVVLITFKACYRSLVQGFTRGKSNPDYLSRS